MIVSCDVNGSKNQLLFGSLEDLKNFCDDILTEEELVRGFTIYYDSGCSERCAHFGGRGISDFGFWVHMLEKIEALEDCK